jgi:hypothetical protein
MKEVHEDRMKVAKALASNKGGPEEELDVQLLYSIVVSIFAVGGMLGGFSGGIIANRFGR